jgi:periplasmic protein CpxP/Spy
MKLHKILIVLACCAALVVTSYAQIPKARMERLKAVAKELNLTPDQEKRLIPILRAEEPRLEAIRDDSSLSRVQKLRQLQAVHQESDPQVKAILTPEQYQKLQEIRQRRRAELMQTARSKANQ